ncbi:hypothetical protein BT63DRAFT_417105 [Microthyrium microscopicum]|uniref:Uncharacterized protein n=1 Tax=Microthyrium microscopicum TaxID=703497 RepID=A0A6A6U1S7_9PEZI|nr:hypothetical protein BT63DRAFT_417105 [Microthyrium microscopicum]
MSLPLSYLDIVDFDDDDNTRIQAVRIACVGEVQELDVPKFESITVLASDLIFRDDYSFVSDLSRFIGVPLSARKVQLDGYWNIDRRNDEAASLFPNCDMGALDPQQPVFGSVPDFWSQDTGPVIVARIDQKPLHPLHAAALVSFAMKEMKGPFRECMDIERAWTHLHGAKEMIFERRRETLAQASPIQFAEFFREYRQRRVQGRPDLALPWHQLNHRQRVEIQKLSPEEIEPRPEWANVPTPFAV